MSDAANAARGANQRLVSELKVSGHLMNLDAGLFCVVQTPSKAADAALGLPGVRISLPPGSASNPDAVSISGFRTDGWLHAGGDAALVRVSAPSAQIMVTVYQAPGTQDAAPNIQVLRLLEPGASAPSNAVALAGAPAPPAEHPEVMDMVAHIQGRGDVGGRIGDWLGEPGSKRWIEGFAVAPLKNVAADDLEYQAVLGRGWMSPWVDGGQFCGSRGMALPILGLRIRLKGEAAEKFECSYSASFVDGTRIGPVAAGEACESAGLAAVEAFQIELRAKAAARPAPVKRQKEKAMSAAHMAPADFADARAAPCGGPA